MQRVRQQPIEKAARSAFIHVRPGKKFHAGISGYRLLRVQTGRGFRMRGAGQLLRKDVDVAMVGKSKKRLK